MSRVLRLIRTRWWVVLGLALFNAWVAGYLTDLRNQELPEWEAVAPVAYTARLGEVDDEPVMARLSEGAAGALEANSEAMEDTNGSFTWETAAIETDERTRRLLFIGRGATGTEAEANAEELQQRFIDAGYLDEARIGELDQQLDLILEQLGELRDRIDAATATEPIDPAVELERALLTDEFSSLRGRHASLRSQLLAPPVDRTTEIIEAELALVRDRLVELHVELGSLPPPPSEDGSTTESESTPPPVESLPTTIDMLQFEQLQVMYRELFIRRLEASSAGTVLPTFVRESTLQPVSRGVNQAAGALVGVVAALFGLVMTDRARGPLWSADEVEGAHVLEELPPRSLWTSQARPWYLRTPPGERKAGIQKLRSVVEVLEADGGVALGISGVAIAPEDVHELAADLAVSLAVSGRRVLLIDADVDNPSGLVEFGRDGITLADLLRLPTDRQGHRQQELATALSNSSEVATNLWAVPSGIHQLDAADTLSRPEFGSLLEAARRMFDMIVVAGTDSVRPSAHVLSQRLDAMMILGGAGRTTASAVTAATRSLSDRRARLLGLILLSRSFGILRGRIRRLRGRSSLRSRPTRETGHGATPKHRLPLRFPARFRRRSGSIAPEDTTGAGEEPDSARAESATRS